MSDSSFQSVERTIQADISATNGVVPVVDNVDVSNLFFGPLILTEYVQMGGVKIGHSNVIQADIVTSNQVIHLIDAVILPEPGQGFDF